MPNDDLKRRMQQFSQRLDWNLLKTFHDIVEANGITAAANVGWHKQSTISLALKRLEAIVGSRLCQRGRVGFELTDEGRVLYDYVKKIYEGIEQTQYEIDNSRYNISGKLDVAIISNFSSEIIDKIFLSFNTECPDVLISIDVLPWSEITTRMVNNDYDIGISPMLYKHGDLRYDFLMREYHNIYCGRQHRLFGKLPDLVAVSDEAFILTGSDEPDTLTSFRLRHRLGQKVTARTPNLEEARRLTVAGVGVCILPEQFVAADVDRGLLWPLLGRTEDLSCDVYVISNTRSQKKAARDAFVGKSIAILNNYAKNNNFD